MKKIFKDQNGSFSVEASLVFPFYLIFMILCLFFVIIFFQIGVVQYVASSAAQSGAYSWNNSQKDFTTSEFGIDQYLGGPDGDSSYWRVTDTLNTLIGEFGFDIFGDKKAEKVSNIENNNQFNFSIQAEYNSMVFYNEVKVKAKSNLYLPSFITKGLGTDSVASESISVYTDTPEMIRTFNFGKYFYTATTNENGDIKNSVGHIKDLITK